MQRAYRTLFVICDFFLIWVMSHLALEEVLIPEACHQDNRTEMSRMCPSAEISI